MAALALAVAALVPGVPVPQARSVGGSDAAETCSVASEAWWTREPLGLFQPEEPLFMGSKRVAELRSLGEVDSATKAGKPTVVMFYAPWCPHCRNTKPVLDKVAERLVNIEFKQIDASGIAEVRGPYGVTGYPTIKYFDAANLEGIKYEWHGANEDDLRGFLERAMVTAVSAYQAVALAVAPTADGSQGWIFDERTFPLERGPWSCPEDQRSADDSECLEAVQQAVTTGGLRVKGLKMVNSGERKRVPRGCSYSVEAEMAIYNKHPNGTSTNGRMYELACISLSHEALKAAHGEQADSTAAHKASKASKRAAHKANKASRSKHAKGPPSDNNGQDNIGHDDHDDDHPEGGPCPGASEDTPHPDVGCHVPGPQPQCNEVHKEHADHDPDLPDCDSMPADTAGSDPWFPSSPPSAASMNMDER